MIVCADAVEWANSYDVGQGLFSAMLCDPPYHLTSIVSRLGKPGSAPIKFGTDGAYRRAAAGFMGQDWDGVGEDGIGIAFKPETWGAFLRILYPGAFVMVFAGSRGQHRLQCAIEDAGFIIHPTIGWCYGEGMPKATRIDTQIDRDAGADREVTGERVVWGNNAEGGRGGQCANGHVSAKGSKKAVPITVPASELSRAWAGHRYGAQALKPALEFICVAQKPYEGRPIDCMTQTGAGALNIDAARIDTRDNLNGGSFSPRGRSSPMCGDDRSGAALGMFRPGAVRQDEYIQPSGRWPANLILQGSAARGVDAQAPESSGGHYPKTRRRGGYNGGFRGQEDLPVSSTSGPASSYFFCVNEAIDMADPLIYQSKPTRTERDAGLESLPDRRIYDGIHDNPKRATQKEREMDTDETAPAKNPHPTIKPLSLARHLATLLLPPALYAPRRLFVPFAGVASEMCGADLAGWEEVVGVERSAEYCRIGELRRRFWAGNVGLFDVTPEEDAQASMALGGDDGDND